MKILKRFLATIVFLIMLPAVVAGSVALVVSTEIQPENLAVMTTNVISETLDKENLKKIKIADFEEYLPKDLTEKLPPDASIEDAVPVIFDNISGLDNYISLDTAKQIIEDDTVKDVVMAIINKEERDFVALFDKYKIPLEDWQREELAKVNTDTIRKGLSDQGFDIDELISGKFLTNHDKRNEQNEISKYLELLNPVVVGGIFVGGLVMFYLIFSLVLWSFRDGLSWWGAGMLVAGVVFLVLNVMKFELVDFALNMTKIDISASVLAPAIEIITRPIAVAGVLEASVGVAAILGGVILGQKSRDD